MKKPIVVVLRHAHRDTSDRDSDNGISDKGRKQVMEGRDLFKEKIADPLGEAALGSAVFLTSPKKRCRETMKPYAELADFKGEVSELLDEQGPAEVSAKFQKRIVDTVSFVETAGKTASLIVLCSHGDWIPEFIEKLSGQRVDLQKGGWVAFQDEKWIAAYRPS